MDLDVSTPDAGQPESSARAERPSGTRRQLPLFEARAPRPPPAPRTPPIPPRSVRLSITDRCDYACVYCRPSRTDGYAESRLDLDAWRTVIDGLVAAGVRRVRLTGGEPLVHPRVVEIVRLVAERGVTDLALTTNASQLARLARPLRDAGLERVNVSIDSLDPARFARLTRGGCLDDVLAGLDAAREAGLTPIKLNTVVLRGENDDELERIVQFAWARGFVPRFLEVMPIAEGAHHQGALVTAGEMRDRLAPLLEAGVGVEEADRGPARYVAARHDATRAVGFISGASDTYCQKCDRLRVSSTGMLRPCLATDHGVEAGDVAAAGDVQAVVARIGEAWAQKPDGSSFRGCTEDSARSVSMRAIGG